MSYLVFKSLAWLCYILQRLFRIPKMHFIVKTFAFYQNWILTWYPPLTYLSHQLDFHLFLFARSSCSFWPDIQRTFIPGTCSRQFPFLQRIRNKRKEKEGKGRKEGKWKLKYVGKSHPLLQIWPIENLLLYICDLPRIIFPFEEEYSRSNMEKKILY